MDIASIHSHFRVSPPVLVCLPPAPYGVTKIYLAEIDISSFKRKPTVSACTGISSRVCFSSKKEPEAIVSDDGSSDSDNFYGCPLIDGPASPLFKAVQNRDRVTGGRMILDGADLSIPKSKGGYVLNADLKRGLTRTCQAPAKRWDRSSS